MTISSETSKSGPYFGNGSTKVFDYQFRIVDASHLTVIKRSAADVEAVLVLNVEYTVADVGHPAGGQITLDTAPASGETITILRNVPFTQETDLENQGAYYAETVEAVFDLMVMRDQQLSERLDRAVVIPASADASDLDELVEDVLRLADSADEIDTVSGIAGDVSAVAADAANITTVANNIADVNAVAAIDDDVATVAASNASVSTVASNIADVQSAAANMSDIQAAPQAASDAEAARDFAYAWSSAAEDAPVNDGIRSGFSAFHWAAKAAALVAGNIAAAIHGADAKPLPADADELALADSADSWSLKKLTWANIKAALSSVFLPKAGGTMTGLLTLAPSDDDPDGTASLNIPAGADVPDVQVDGDLWADSNEDLRYRRGGEDAAVYDTVNLPLPSQVEAEAGTETTPRAWSAQRVKQAIEAHTAGQKTVVAYGSISNAGVLLASHGVAGVAGTNPCRVTLTAAQPDSNYIVVLGGRGGSGATRYANIRAKETTYFDIGAGGGLEGGIDFAVFA